jgi:hypothetical protein
MKTFILALHKDGTQYEAVLYADNVLGARLASHPFEADVDDFARRFRDTSEGDDLLALGQELYDLVAPALDAYLQARAASRPVRLLLNIQDDGLRKLSWELMVKNNIALFWNPSFPICRLRSFGQGGGEQLSERDWPLRVLIVVASQENDPAVDAEGEVSRIVDAIVPHEGGIDWKLMKRPKHERLVEELEQFKPHIFHFIGHGGLSHGSSILKLFDPDDNNNFNWDVITLGNDLTGRVKNLRLAFINACRTSEVAQVGLWTMTDAFLDAGASAVIGTRAEITGTAAARCAGAFYEELFKDLAIDVAMARARQQIGMIKLRDWAVPCLELRLPPPDLFSSCMTLHPDPDEIKRYFWRVRKYVGRQDISRKAWQERLVEKKRLAVIRGVKGVGKTAAAEMLLERCLLADHVVRYVDMEQRGDEENLGKSNYVHLMRATLQGDPNPFSLQPHTEPFPDAALNAFEDLLETLGVDPNKSKGKDVDRLFEGFRKIAEEAYPDKPILLVYDNLDDVVAEALTKTIEEFGRWQREGSRVHTLLIISDPKEQELRKELAVDEPHFNVMTLELFKPERYKELSFEFARRLVIARQVRSSWQVGDYDAYKQKTLRIIEWLQEELPVPTDWLPKELELIENILVYRRFLEQV